jgi:hypothetical protein
LFSIFLSWLEKTPRPWPLPNELWLEDLEELLADAYCFVTKAFAFCDEVELVLLASPVKLLTSCADSTNANHVAKYPLPVRSKGWRKVKKYTPEVQMMRRKMAILFPLF